MSMSAATAQAESRVALGVRRIGMLGGAHGHEHNGAGLTLLFCGRVRHGALPLSVDYRPTNGIRVRPFHMHSKWLAHTPAHSSTVPPLLDLVTSQIDGCLVRCAGSLRPSHLSSGARPSDLRISSGSSRRAVCSGSHASECAYDPARAIRVDQKLTGSIHRRPYVSGGHRYSAFLHQKQVCSASSLSVKKLV